MTVVFTYKRKRCSLGVLIVELNFLVMLFYKHLFILQSLNLFIYLFIYSFIHVFIYHKVNSSLVWGLKHTHTHLDFSAFSNNLLAVFILLCPELLCTSHENVLTLFYRLYICRRNSVPVSKRLSACLNVMNRKFVKCFTYTNFVLRCF
jgi:hypothetical protein